MRVRVIAKKVPGVGSYGQERHIDGPSARALIALGKVVKVEPPKPAPKPAPQKKRAYKRRDIVAEAAKVEAVIDEPELPEKAAKDDVFIGYPYERDE